jgi:superfamily II DNA/RNA helicase
MYRGEMDKVERRVNLKAFRDGKVDLLVSTDLAARGIDVEHVSRVINHHLPQELDNYLHRVGRTARAGRPGLVINFVTERDRPLLAQLEAMQGKAPRREHGARTGAGRTDRARIHDSSRGRSTSGS